MVPVPQLLKTLFEPIYILNIYLCLRNAKTLFYIHNNRVFSYICHRTEFLKAHNIPSNSCILEFVKINVYLYYHTYLY